jgi:hypothetical protein
MVAATALKLLFRGHLQRHDLLTEFRKNVPNDSKVDGGAYTGRMIISLANFFPLGRKVG